MEPRPYFGFIYIDKEVAKYIYILIYKAKKGLYLNIFTYIYIYIGFIYRYIYIFIEKAKEGHLSL